MFKTLNVEVKGIVTNMARFIVPSSGEEFFIFGDPEQVAEESKRLETPILGEIPLDTKVRRGGDEGKPVVIGEPDSPVAKAFIELARTVAKVEPLGEGGEDGDDKKGLFSFLKS